MYNRHRRKYGLPSQLSNSVAGISSVVVLYRWWTGKSLYQTVEDRIFWKFCRLCDITPYFCRPVDDPCFSVHDDYVDTKRSVKCELPVSYKVHLQSIFHDSLLTNIYSFIISIIPYNDILYNILYILIIQYILLYIFLIIRNKYNSL